MNCNAYSKIILTLFAFAGLFFAVPIAAQPILNTSEFKYKAEQGKEYPWEVRSETGESYLPDVFYAEDVQNQQIMPTRLQLDRSGASGSVSYGINRLIYPTLGNPNLFIKGGADSLLFVLRLERTLYQHLGPVEDKKRPKPKKHLKFLSFTEADESNTVNFYLVKREGRGKAESGQSVKADKLSSDVIQIQPNEILLQSMDNLPEEFQKRDTLRIVFRKKALSQVAPGLYDIRFEVLHGGKLTVHEFQYNAVRIFPGSVDQRKYSVINVADSQVSISKKKNSPALGKSWRAATHDMLKNFVQHVNVSQDESIKNAAFITFNGDLHNGGATTTLWPRGVAETYNREAAAIVTILRDLKFPIFLTAGNHDGYVSMGHVPRSIQSRTGRSGWLGALLRFTFSAPDRTSLKDVVTEARSPQIWEELKAFLKRTAGAPGGLHRDIFTGRFVRRAFGIHKGIYWARMPGEHRNRVLYDGFYQWRRSYGPLFFSWNFGDNHYVSVNSFDLRQHRRSGWGMYTVNYGGGISEFQLHWLQRDIILNNTGKYKHDVTLISHHDPRGGNGGRDFPYYFKQLDYKNIGQPATKTAKDVVITRFVCNNVPDFVKTKKFKYNCMKDGLQEWMRPDADFDCRSEFLATKGKRAGLCDYKAMGKRKQRRIYSGYQLLHMLAKRKNIRTLLLGHTHTNSLEVHPAGDVLVPGELKPDLKTLERLARLEYATSLRTSARKDRAKTLLGAVVKEGREYSKLSLSALGHNFKRKLLGHELVILRLTTVAKITFQKAKNNGKAMIGFAVFDIFQDEARKDYTLPQINGVRYHQFQPSWIFKDGYKDLNPRVRLDRTKRVETQGAGNPLRELVKFK